MISARYGETDSANKSIVGFTLPSWSHLCIRQAGIKEFHGGKTTSSDTL